ncbi:TPA: Dot/Icm T4SS effector LegK2 [Legionella pneumophila]|uniref:Calmodulin-dependent protein kinase n=5 Tax=Legionella pneumophila TaxID=446 RepID=Q5ZTM4_LEGPH|nr:Dot/Icm T4SS effector LegK2 [Legionella pneumophila]WBV63914.1 Dot/Icm T4SS effector LegK2 [Legionella pneumophila 130b]AAU28203.1 calmodulin-dependent protein kinase [Legionella pneumophila subsp. pneumophila str. Philadelphia 1]AEW52378.1 calmodulin-dependent protein kinase [Legionella pneumophila subsp. pneumophila ATCC 43290]AGH53056.1 Calmodulin-dependent protein kinase [Legionella pneumophila subsp. pneumophila LPE509]AGN15053.1 calmodulin-dependent protein kinase [Legionella pneumoph
MVYYINLKEQPLHQDKEILTQLIKQYLLSGSSQSALFANHPYTLNDEDGNEIEFLLSHDIYKNQREDGITEFLILNGSQIGRGTKGVVIQSNHAMYLIDDELVIFPKENVLKVLYQNFINAEELIKQESVNYSILSGNSTAELVNLQGGNQGFFMQKEEGYALEELLEDIDSLQKLTFSDKMELAISFLTELENLHNKGYAHGDLTFKNILYNEKNNQLKIIDAGEMKVADERFWAQDISIAIEMISLLFTTNETNQFKASRYWSDEPTVRRIVNPNPVEAKLNRILNSEYRCVSDLKLAIERNYNEYLNNSNLVLKKNVELESEALGLQAYKNQMSKQQLLGEIQGFKENYWNMKDLLTLTNRHHLRVFLEYLDNICSAFKDDKTDEKSARAAYDFLNAQINKLFEDNSKNSKPSFESFSEDVQRFLIHIDTYLMKNPSACSNSIASTIQLLKQLDNKKSFNPEQSFKDFCSYKEITIQLLLKPFETPVAEMASAPAIASDLIEKQSDTKRKLQEMKSSANQDKQPIFTPSLMRGPS